VGGGRGNQLIERNVVDPSLRISAPQVWCLEGRATRKVRSITKEVKVTSKRGAVSNRGGGGGGIGWGVG